MATKPTGRPEGRPNLPFLEDPERWLVALAEAHMRVPIMRGKDGKPTKMSQNAAFKLVAAHFLSDCEDRPSRDESLPVATVLRHQMHRGDRTAASLATFDSKGKHLARKARGVWKGDDDTAKWWLADATGCCMATLAYSGSGNYALKLQAIAIANHLDDARLRDFVEYATSDASLSAPPLNKIACPSF
jgi:hypothetical protein